MTDEQIKVLLTKRMGYFANRQVLQNEFTIYRTNWRNKNNFYGAFSYMHATTTVEDWENMAKPVFEPGWYFCGEHTTTNYRGTVYGAYLSG